MNKQKILIASVVLIFGLSLYGLGFSHGKNVALVQVSKRNVLHATPSKDALSFVKESELEMNTVDMNPFWKAWTILDNDFIPSNGTEDTTVAKDRLVWLLRGLAASYNDPYTVFVSGDESQKLKETIDGAFEGIGAVLEKKGDIVIVKEVFKNSPAFEQGISQGDQIVGVNGLAIVGLELKDVVSKIRGPKDSTVALSVIKKGETEMQTIELARKSVVIPTTLSRVITKATTTISDSLAVIGSYNKDTTATVSYSVSENSNDATSEAITYIRLASFSKTSTDAFVSLLKKANENTQSKGIILDLRGNPGGLDVAVEVVSHILPKDALIVTEKSSNDKDATRSVSHGYATLRNDVPIVVLVDSNSASASEIVAGALKDHKRATIVGEKTFGKGSVQNVLEFKNLGILKYTHALWYTPSGEMISGKGIVPDVTLATSGLDVQQSKDPLLDLAVFELSKQQK